MDHLTAEQNLKIEDGLWGLVFLALMVPMIFLRGLTIMLLWGWFVVPLGLPVIGMALSMGLGLFAVYITGANKTIVRRDAGKIDMGKSLRSTITYPVIVIILGFIFHLFV